MAMLQIVHDELVKLMGGEISELQFAKSGPTVILLAGLQGVGKTTVCAKLACYLKKQVCFLKIQWRFWGIVCYSLSITLTNNDVYRESPACLSLEMCTDLLPSINLSF